MLLQRPAIKNQRRLTLDHFSAFRPPCSLVNNNARRTPVLAVTAAARGGIFSICRPTLRRFAEMAKAKAPNIGSRKSPQRNSLLSGWLLDNMMTPQITRQVPRKFCRPHSSPTKKTAKTEAIMGDEFTIGT